MSKNQLDRQVGGSHYKNMAYQPAQFRHDLHLLANPGAIIKYISRDKYDRGEDFEKAIHFCGICKQLNDVDMWTMINRIRKRRTERLVIKYVNLNNFRFKHEMVAALLAVIRAEWDKAADCIKELEEQYHC